MEPQESEHKNAAVMLAQLRSTNQSAQPDFQPAPLCPPPGWGYQPNGWHHPAYWSSPQFAMPRIGQPALGPHMMMPGVHGHPHSGLQMGTHVSQESGSSSPETGNDVQKKFRTESNDSDTPKVPNVSSSFDDGRSRFGSQQSGTQRRPNREDYTEESEYLLAYNRWRQVRDRNNDAVKRSREKYRAKKTGKPAAPVSEPPPPAPERAPASPPPPFRVEIQPATDDPLDVLRAKLSILARAYCNQELTYNEREQLKAILAEYC